MVTDLWQASENSDSSMIPTGFDIQRTPTVKQPKCACELHGTWMIEPAAIDNRDPCAVANALQYQFACGIDPQSKSQTAAFTKPEKQWGMARFVAGCTPRTVGGPSGRSTLECKQFAAPELPKRSRAIRIGTLTYHRSPLRRVLSRRRSSITGRRSPSSVPQIEMI